MSQGVTFHILSLPLPYNQGPKLGIANKVASERPVNFASTPLSLFLLSLHHYAMWHEDLVPSSALSLTIVWPYLCHLKHYIPLAST